MTVLELENHYSHHEHKKEKKRNLVKSQFLPSYRGSSETYLLLLRLMVNFFYLFYRSFFEGGRILKQGLIIFFSRQVLCLELMIC